MEQLLKNFYQLALTTNYEVLADLIERKSKQVIEGSGKEVPYRELLKLVPELFASTIDLTSDWIRIGQKEEISHETYNKLYNQLYLFSPWRKGPFDIFGIKIDTEWVSYLKWNRLKDHIAPLSGKRILDIGSSNGYYMFKMASSHPEMVLGIEPYLTFYIQYLVLKQFIHSPNIYCLPVKLEELPKFKKYFDTIFCMGILYHRRSPIDTLKQIHNNMRTEGELVLETLIIDGDDNISLFPEDRYAKMRNVFFIPTIQCLSSWLRRAGFSNIRCIDITPTAIEEQRKTDWIDTESLEDFLDRDHPDKTVEGYPAPVRAIVLANAK